MTAVVPAADAAIVFGSGLAVVPDGMSVDRRVSYAALGWPRSGVAGHGGEVAVAGRTLLALGRCHAYEGWSRTELERPVGALAAAGVSRLVVTCATGALRDDLRPGDVVVVERVVDLQTAPEVRPRLLWPSSDREARLELDRVGSDTVWCGPFGPPPRSGRPGEAVEGIVALFLPEGTAAELRNTLPRPGVGAIGAEGRGMIACGRTDRLLSWLARFEQEG